MPKAQVTKVSYDDGKTWIDVPDHQVTRTQGEIKAVYHD